MASIRKRNNSYTITVSCGYDVSGKKITRTMTWKPENSMTQKQIEKEVQRQATLFEERVQNGTVSACGSLKLVDFVPQYLENIQSEVSITTLENYKRIIRDLIVPALGHLKLKDIKPLHIQKFVNALSTGEYRLDGQNKPYKPATVRRYYVVLQSILHNAYRLELIASNPADSQKIKLPAMGEQTTEIYSKEELAEMLQCLDDEPLMFQVLIHLAINTGCRRGELAALEWADINFSERSVRISKSLYKVKGQPIRTKDTKTHESRMVAIPEYCITLLRRWQSVQAETRLKLGTAWRGADWVFIQSDGGVIYPTSPTLMFSDFLERHGLPHKKFHALRHTSATLLLVSGANIKNVSARLGHAQISTTNRYVHAIEEADRAAGDTLGNIVNNLQLKKA
ncbi:MAG: tyrosine-type recombinase/integrase [Acutalibacteraceae bacterium]